MNDIDSLERGKKVGGYISVPNVSIAGAAIPVVCITGTEQGPVLSIHAGIHGDEYEGTYTLLRLMGELKPEMLSCGTLVLCPVVNTLAFTFRSRENPLDNVDLARVFPGSPSGTASLSLADAFFRTIVEKSDYVVGLHSAGTSMRVVPFVEYFDASGAVGQRSFELAKAFGVRYLRRLRMPRPEDRKTCTSVAVECGIPAIEPEIGGEQRCDPDHAGVFLRGVYGVMNHLGMLAGEPEYESECCVVDSEWVTIDREGFFVPSARLEQEVKRGETIGALYDLFGAAEPVAAPLSGTVMGIRTLPVIRSGEVVAHIGTPVETVETQNRTLD